MLFTDGLVDQRNRDGDDYSEARLWRLLRTHADRTVGEMRDAIEADGEQLRKGEPPVDDLTFMIFRYR